MRNDLPLPLPGPATDGEPPSTRPCRLLVFVGTTLRPSPETAATLQRAGWHCAWMATPAQAEEAAHGACVDAVVLQAESCGGPPARLTDRLRQAMGCPVLVVAEQADEIDEIIALELGADAFLVGTLAPRRLRAHLQALLRRRDDATADAGPPQAVALGPWTLDTVNQRLQGEHRQVALTGLQCQLLQRLADPPGRIVPRDALMHALGPGRALHQRSVDVYVARLRRRLREQRVHALAIEGVRGRGYALDIRPPAVAAGPLPWLPRAPVWPVSGPAVVR